MAICVEARVSVTNFSCTPTLTAVFSLHGFSAGFEGKLRVALLSKSYEPVGNRMHTYFPSFHVIFHFLFHLILHYIGAPRVEGWCKVFLLSFRLLPLPSSSGDINPNTSCLGQGRKLLKDPQTATATPLKSPMLKKRSSPGTTSLRVYKGMPI